MRHRASFAALLVCLTVACDWGQPPPLVTVVRLLDHLGPEAQGAVGDDCWIGDELRPALGCTRWRPAKKVVVPSTEGAVSFRVPPARARGPFVVQGQVVRRGGVEALPPVTMPAGPMVRFDFGGLGDAAPEPGATVVFSTRTVPPAGVLTAGVQVPEHAELVVGIGLDPMMDAQGVDAVTFRLRAHAAGGTHELLRATLRPDDAATSHWQEHRIDLGAVAGAHVRFRFETSVLPRPGVPAGSAAAMPLWGAPEILAPPPEGPGEPPNVILVSFDTLRADYVGTYGSERPTTPHLDRLAAEGTVFERAYTTFPTTTASHVSMLTGLYPRRHGVRAPTNALDARIVSLARALADAGWRTGAVTENGMLTARAGIARGFSWYRENREPEPDGKPSWTARETFGTAMDWLGRAATDRFFLFVHTYVVHWPYAPPPEFDPFTTWQDGDVERPRSAAPRMLKLQLAYAGETRFGDAQLGELVDALERLGLRERTLLVVTSDHGEEFGEHGQWGHGKAVYDEVLQVPLVLWGPGRVPAGHRITTPVSLVDVTPTVLELAGVPMPPDLDGESQAPRLRGAAEEPERAVFAELRDATDPSAYRTAVRTGSGKWITRPGAADELEAYDLVADPGETRPVTDAVHLERGRRLLAAYRGTSAEAAGDTAFHGAAAPLDTATQEKLRALGYVD